MDKYLLVYKLNPFWNLHYEHWRNLTEIRKILLKIVVFTLIMQRYRENYFMVDHNNAKAQARRGKGRPEKIRRCWPKKVRVDPKYAKVQAKNLDLENIWPKKCEGAAIGAMWEQALNVGI